MGMWEEIVWGGEEGEGEDGWLRGGEGEVCECEGGMGREEKWRFCCWLDLASGGADGGSGVVLGSEEWTVTERDDVEMCHVKLHVN
ncbi:uncharacterized protein MONOS_7859 [Monocercomonoides exilis]|uniref:uncharacterized protein n=1 Tax=Monocercomonoides exilis TaxID=2049356 RepID=UPI00355A8A98|nr:hypothetical protein MONOS_7859 [Monocercomonoides exilis]|eukprot:MONOS_7859.1-p1 / transcript=MONOS_7859.1 / gene=MONOS_7859 / organism=Monocercomonoides_exilis_PA203 / gene_product=unspecified product / transcript_product=unspecified product / location=Mono_scaffold00280:55468-55725(-) / protein_length=86 / sequence_SO=supercontig / SO=protein_coding / is_pseudo=false